jgi:hypothetical protein
MPLETEPWPGERWYRDLGDGKGHFWGHVQAIRRPTLLEITGPLFMSHPVVSNVQCPLSEAGGGTFVKFHHTALRLIEDEKRIDVRGHIHERVRKLEEGQSSRTTAAPR